jgi:hypothetical protein
MTAASPSRNPRTRARTWNSLEGIGCVQPAVCSRHASTAYGGRSATTVVSRSRPNQPLRYGCSGCAFRSLSPPPGSRSRSMTAPRSIPARGSPSDTPYRRTRARRAGPCSAPPTSASGRNRARKTQARPRPSRDSNSFACPSSTTARENVTYGAADPPRRPAPWANRRVPTYFRLARYASVTASRRLASSVPIGEFTNTAISTSCGA